MRPHRPCGYLGVRPAYGSVETAFRGAPSTECVKDDYGPRPTGEEGFSPLSTADGGNCHPPPLRKHDPKGEPLGGPSRPGRGHVRSPFGKDRGTSVTGSPLGFHGRRMAGGPERRIPA